jgi:putative transposase
MARKRTRYREAQITRILKRVESGITVAEVCWKSGIGEQTVYRWRNPYGGLEISALQRLRELDAENSRLKRTVAQQALDQRDGVNDVVSPRARRSVVEPLVTKPGLSQRHACQGVGIQRTRAPRRSHNGGAESHLCPSASDVRVTGSLR